jgi:flagellar assembly protein FliH
LSNNKIFKNNQVNVGIPFLVKSPVTYQPPVIRVNNFGTKIASEELEETSQVDYKAIGEEIINKAKIEADYIIKEALLEAKEIITKASVEVQELRDKTLQESEEEGYSTGIARAQEEYEGLLQEAGEIKEQAGVEYKQVLDSLEADAVNTIIAISKKVISKELECKENILLLVKEAFEKCSKDHKSVLKLSGQDYDYVNENKDKLMSMLERSEEIEIKKDLSLKEGGCVIDTPFGSIDASADTKFEKIENDFESLLEEKIS